MTTLRHRDVSLAATTPPPAPAILGRIGALRVRLAKSDADVEAAQRLRFDVFHRPRGLTGEHDADRFDDLCDHLLVESDGEVVATYRLLPGERVKPDEFYTANEFDIAPLVRRHASCRFLELGRSCVAPAWRNRRTMELLWHGTWAYVVERGHDVLFGCASLPGADPQAHAPSLAFLRAHARAVLDWRVRAVDGRGVSMEGVPDARALRSLPPLLKGYLRLGAEVGEEAIVDADFGTVDVLVLLRRSRISQRYIAHYGADASRFASQG